jgi:hypothetical protein
MDYTTGLGCRADLGFDFDSFSLKKKYVEKDKHQCLLNNL